VSLKDKLSSSKHELELLKEKWKEFEGMVQASEKEKSDFEYKVEKLSAKNGLMTKELA